MGLNFQDQQMSAKFRNEYIYVHKWVYKTLGKANHCEMDKKHKSKVFEWSNKSQKYLRDVNDWIQLCQSCHRKLSWNEDTKNILRKRNMGNKYHVKKIRQIDLKGNLIKEWESGRSAARFLKLTPSSISNVISGRCKTAGGYIWA